MEATLELVGAVTSGIVASTAAIGLLIKAYGEAANRRHQITKDQLAAIVELQSLPEAERDPFVIEQTFHFRFKRYIRYTTILYLLGYLNPTDAFDAYLKAAAYAELDVDGARFIFRKPVHTDFKRMLLRVGNSLSYFFFAFAAIAAIFGAFIGAAFGQYRFAIFSALYVIGFALIAMLNLWGYSGICRAEDLVLGKLPRKPPKSNEKPSSRGQRNIQPVRSRA